MKHTLTLTTVLVVFTAIVAACNRPASNHSTDRATRGEYLVSVIGCSDCHTPMKIGPNGPEPDMTRFLFGHPEQMGPLAASAPQGPWIWAIWTEEMFIAAMRTGKHMGTSREMRRRARHRSRVRRAGGAHLEPARRQAGALPGLHRSSDDGGGAAGRGGLIRQRRRTAELWWATTFRSGSRLGAGCYSGGGS